jgi:peptidoglycan/LPS O-acetylase OafA/YrhL
MLHTSLRTRPGATATGERPTAEAEIDRGVRMGYRPELDGLRAVAVIAVVAFHFFGRFQGGFLGVDLFFLLSGFLITRLLLEERHRVGHIRLGRFYARRAARLLPALGVVCAVTLLVAATGLGPSVGDVLRAIGLALGYVLNWSHVFGAVLPLEHLWSLSVEEQFYVIWPILLVALLAWGGMRVARRVAGAIILVAVVQMAIRFQSGVDFDALYQGTDGQGAVFLMSGCLLGMVVATTPGDLARSVAGRAARLAVIPAGIVLVAWVFALPRENPFWYRGGFLVAVVLMAAVVVTTLTGGALARVLRTAPLVWVGRLSYAIYLWHVPLRAWIGDAWPGLGFTAAAVLAGVLTLACAALTYYAVEMPMRNWAASRINGRSAAHAAPSPVAVSA